MLAQGLQFRIVCIYFFIIFTMHTWRISWYGHVRNLRGSRVPYRVTLESPRLVKFLLPQGRLFYGQFSLLLFASRVFISLGVNHIRQRVPSCYDCQWLGLYYYCSINRFYLPQKCFISVFNSIDYLKAWYKSWDRLKIFIDNHAVLKVTLKWCFYLNKSKVVFIEAIKRIFTVLLN